MKTLEELREELKRMRESHWKLWKKYGDKIHPEPLIKSFSLEIIKREEELEKEIEKRMKLERK